MPDVTLTTVQKENGKEEIRVIATQFKGVPRIDVRTWYQPTPGTFAPGRQGISLTFNEAKLLFEQAPARLKQLLEAIK